MSGGYIRNAQWQCGGPATLATPTAGAVRLQLGGGGLVLVQLVLEPGGVEWVGEEPSAMVRQTNGQTAYRFLSIPSNHC